MHVFETSLRETLAHLYDPNFTPPGEVCAAFGCVPGVEIEPVRTAIIQAIETLQPGADIPAQARIRRYYDLLHLRYVKGLTQQETADRLTVSARHLRREQQEAIHFLVVHLYRNPESPAADSTADAPPEWQAQLREDLAVLESPDQESSSNLREVFQGVEILLQQAAALHQVRLVIEMPAPEVEVSMPASALRQVLVAVFSSLLRQTLSSTVTCRSRQFSPEVVAVELMAGSGSSQRPEFQPYITEMLDYYGGSVEADWNGDQVCVQLNLSGARLVRVLAVDDNKNLAYLYQRYTANTRFHIIPVFQGEAVFTAVQEHDPDIILLDVMMGGMDGWEILSTLRTLPATSKIPVIVCSVVVEPELALSLGACAYLRKPVKRADFLEALGVALKAGRAG